MSNTHRYKQFEKLMTAGLLACAGLFVLYLITAAAGIVWLKGILSVLILGGSAVGLWILYTSKELLRQRSLWLSCGFFAVLLCCLVSLILGYPG